VNKSDLLEQVIPHLPPVGKPAASPVVDRLYWIRAAGEQRGHIKPFNILYVDSIKLSKSLEFDEILRVFADDLEMYIAENAKRRLFLHAGVVGWKGKAILLPGKSMTGKSTLVHKLVQAGATYYSDEFAVLDPHGFVHPYPRPLSIRHDLNEEPTRIAATELKRLVAAKPLPIGLVAVSQYESRGVWRPRQLSAGKAVLALLANTVTARRRPELALSLLPQITTRVPVLSSARGDADLMVSDLLSGTYWN
jgi:hypothetical protein